MAPGPGRSPAASTVLLYDGGVQKMLARMEPCGNPSVRQAAGMPVSVMVRTGPWPNAPDVRCRQRMKGAVVHWLSAVQGCGGFSKAGENCWPQAPQKTNCCAEGSVDVSVCVPVVSASGIGRLPMKALVAGGQSWLVG